MRPGASRFCPCTTPSPTTATSTPSPATNSCRARQPGPNQLPFIHLAHHWRAADPGGASRLLVSSHRIPRPRRRRAEASRDHCRQAGRARDGAGRRDLRDRSQDARLRRGRPAEHGAEKVAPGRRRSFNEILGLRLGSIEARFPPAAWPINRSTTRQDEERCARRRVDARRGGACAISRSVYERSYCLCCVRQP